MHIHSVYLYVCDTMSDWEYGHLIAELNSGRYFKKGRSALHVIPVGLTKEPVTTMGGLTLTPEATIDECVFDAQTLLILPGSNTWTDSLHQPLLSKVGEALDNGSLVAAICGATIGLANSGYLDDTPHTSNDLGYLKMICPLYQSESFYETTPVVSHANLITATGIAPLEFARAVLEKIGVFTPDVLQAWYQLNKTQDPAYFGLLMTALSSQQ